jgi:Ca-activated chloride channel family protein
VVVDVRLRSSIPLRSIHCPSHEAAAVSRPGEREARVSFEARQVRADKDFIVAWNVSEDALAPTVLAHRSPAGGDGDGLSGFFLFSVSPRAEAGRKAPPKDVVFLLDTSGSMLGDKMEQARKALRHGIAGLNAGDRFNIIDFSTEARRFRDGLVEAGEETRRAANAHIDELKARGGTNIEEGVRLALSDLQSRDRLQLVVFLSDGEPTVGVTNAADILRMVKEKNPEKRRVFVFGVGEDLNAKLLDAIARDTRGASQYIRSNENLEVPVSNFFDKIDSPVLTDITIEFPAGGVADLYPRPLPDLFRGEQLEVFGRYGTDGQRTVVVRGKLHGEERVFEYSLPFTAASNPYLPRLWALRKVGYLLEQIRLSGETAEVKEEVIRLSKLYGIITPYTSYLILEEDRRLTQAGSARPQALYRLAARDALTGRGGRAEGAAAAPEAEALAESRVLSDALARKRAFGAESGAQAVEASREVLALKTGTAGDVMDQFVDGTVNSGSERLKRAGDRTFYLQGSRWVDSALTDKDLASAPDIRRIKYLSDEYFQLLAEDAAIGKLLAVGSEVTFLWQGKVVAIEA